MTDSSETEIVPNHQPCAVLCHWDDGVGTSEDGRLYHPRCGDIVENLANSGPLDPWAAVTKGFVSCPTCIELMPKEDRSPAQEQILAVALKARQLGRTHSLQALVDLANQGAAEAGMPAISSRVPAEPPITNQELSQLVEQIADRPELPMQPPSITGFSGFVPDQDPEISALEPAPPPMKKVDEYALMRVGAALAAGEEEDTRVDDYLEEQRKIYKEYRKDVLIEELLRRDKNLIRQGKEAADGRTAGRLLREFVRGILYNADQAELKSIEGGLAQGARIDRILRMLGAEPTPQRDLRLNGGTMAGKIGTLEEVGVDPEIAIQSPREDQRQGISRDTAEAIREREN